MSRAPSLPELVADESDADVTSQCLAGERTATDLEPLGANATGEIDAIDILEVSDPAAPQPQASSIGPMALDVPPARVSLASLPSCIPPPPSTLQLARAAGVPTLSARFVVIATSVVGMCLIAGGVGAVIGYSRISREPTVNGEPAVHAPRVAVVLGAREEITESPRTAPAKVQPAFTPPCGQQHRVRGPGSSVRLVSLPCAGRPTL